jgi:hypothetical protein
MSDALLERIAKALETIAANGKVAPAAAGAAPRPPAPGAANKPAAGAAGAANKAGAGAGAPNKPGTNKPAAAPPAATKAPGGKYNLDQVRDIIRKVAANPALGKQAARDVLDTDGGGVATVSEVKPENFDALYEACQVLLSGEGGGAGAADDFDPTA